MTTDSPIREYLITRRAKVRPEDLGLPRGTRRRVPGLRREEVATLAGVSVEYYVQIERGNLAGVSDEVLAAIARALLLDDAETAHLFDLARTSGRTRPRPDRPTSRPAPAPDTALLDILDALSGAAGMIQDGRLNTVSANPLAAALFSGVLDTPEHDGNFARYIFLDHAAPRFYDDWNSIADDAVAMLQLQAGRTPRDRELSDLIGELATRSDEFRTRWAQHDVKSHDRGIKRINHPEIGPLVLQFQRMDIPGPGALMMFTYTPPRDDTPSRDSMALLATLAATREIGTQTAESNESQLK